MTAARRRPRWFGEYCTRSFSPVVTVPPMVELAQRSLPSVSVNLTVTRVTG